MSEFAYGIYTQYKGGNRRVKLLTARNIKDALKEAERMLLEENPSWESQGIASIPDGFGGRQLNLFMKLGNGKTRQFAAWR